MNELAFQKLVARVRGSEGSGEEPLLHAQPSQSRTAAETPALLPTEGEPLLNDLPLASAGDPALLEAEEELFRLWWRTLPDKISARKRWVDIARYYGRAKGLSNAFINALLVKVQDLAEEGMKRQPERRRR